MSKDREWVVACKTKKLSDMYLQSVLTVLERNNPVMYKLQKTAASMANYFTNSFGRELEAVEASLTITTKE